MRDRLIELYKKIEKEPAITCPAYKTDKTCKDCQYSINDSLCNHIERQVDYLLANGVVALPCKVGTEVYLSDYIDKHHRLKEYKFIGNKIAVVIECWEFQGTCTRWLDDFGKTVFLTREEAERALKGGD